MISARHLSSDRGRPGTKRMSVVSVLARRGTGRPRRAMVALLGFTAAGCAGIDQLVQLSATADAYFNSFEFGYDLYYAATLVGSVLGSGSLGP